MRAALILLATNLLLALPVEAWSADPFPGIDPGWILLHEPAVIEELGLGASERQAIQKLMDDSDLRVFPLRNQAREEMLPALARILDETQRRLTVILQPAQSKRLNEILIRRLGTGALLRDNVAAKMRYAEAQRLEIEKIVSDTRTSVTALENEASEGKPREALEKKYTALKYDEQKQVWRLLSPNQQATWQELIGPDFDLTKLGRPLFKAPELVDTSEWINSAPLKLEGLRGQVVVVHFYACGCINCIRNYPWYQQWHDAFKGKGVALIGIHTPETESERDSANVRRKAAAEKFAFPILIDGKNENWNAWGNSMWPSVYLLDKRGYLRQFWPGELNWQANNGQQYMREWIEKLLAESSF